MHEIDTFLDEFTPALIVELNQLETGRGGSFVASTHPGRVNIARCTPEDPPPHELIASLVDDGASGAAFLNYLADRDEVIAQILVAHGGLSDIRRAHVEHAEEGVTLGPWEYAVTG
jgi:hypothetical protein